MINKVINPIKNKRLATNFLKPLISIFLFSSMIGSAQAIERYVNTVIDDPYLSGSLRHQVNVSRNGDIIKFEPHLHGRDIILQPYFGPIEIHSSIKIIGDIDGDLKPDITINGNHRVQLFTIYPPSYGVVTLTGLNITNGYSSGSGGCIKNYSYRKVNILDSTITNCTAYRDGGGIFNRGKIVIRRSLIADNSASRGAGIVTFSEEQPLIVDSMLVNNKSSRWGGAIYSYGNGTLHIERSIIQDNYARGAGAGVFVHGPTNTFGLQVIDTTIANNFSEGSDTNEDMEGVGGGISAGGLGDVLISNSTLSSNTAGRDGGAIILRNAGLRTIRHSTIAFNRNDIGGLGPRFSGNNHPPGGEHKGAGIQNDPGQEVILDHVLFSENGRVLYPSEGGQVDDVSGGVESRGFNLFQQGEIEFTMGPGPGDILFGFADLLSLTKQGGTTPTHALGDGSQALNAGNPSVIPGNNTTPLFDQRGQPRINMQIIDIGAFER